jgi:superfamily II DNA or RNA helicase
MVLTVWGGVTALPLPQKENPMATLQIADVIRVDKGTLNPHVVHTKFTYPNPKYQENIRLGFSNFGVPQQISLFSENGDFLYFPRGLISQVREINPGLEIADQTISNPVQFNPSKIILKEFQIPAVEQILQRNQGLLVAPPGSGKTICGIESIVKRVQKSLVLVHTKDLLQQWVERFQEFTDIQPGAIQEGEFDIKDVTIGMVQSLNKPLDKDFVNQFGLVLLDECHHCPAFTFQKLINQFPAQFRYGLTATPNRRDGLSFVLTGVIGNVIHEIKRDDLFQNGEIMEPFVKVAHTNFYLPDVQNYGAMITALTEDEERNELILKFVAEEAKAGHSCLVLSERIDHVHALWEQFCLEYQDLPSVGITSRSTKKMRDAALREMSQGKFRVLFSTKLADEGLDIPRLDRLFLTCPIRSVNKVNQQIGRILRKFPGKQDAVVFDFRDSLVSLAESQFHTRLKQVYHDFDLVEVLYAAS